MDNQIRRRDLFKVLGASGAVAATAVACAEPPEKLIPYLLPPTNIEFVPGNPLEYATTCTECAAACGMVVRTREGRVIKADGNPDHPFNQGTLCIRGQASVQTHYNPTRYRSAMVRKGQQWEAIDWAQGEKLLADKIKAVSDKKQILYLTGHAAGTRSKFLDAWLAAMGASPKIVVEPLGLHNIKAANERSFKRAEVPVYRIGDAAYLLNFGSEFLETWANPVLNAREYTAMHAFDAANKRRGKFVHVAPHVSLTGANADEWVSCKPGSEGVLALALAKVVLEKARKVSGGEAERIGNYLKPYTLEKASEASGVKPETIERVGEEFAAVKSLALAGGNLVASESGTATQMAVNLLNYVAGNIGSTVQFGAANQIDQSAPFSKVLEAFQRMQLGQVKVLIVDETNPVYNLPPGAKAAEAIAKVDFVVSLSSAQNETSALAHLVLPGQTGFERWGDAFPQRGVYSLVQPVMTPVFPVKAAEDTLLSVATALGSTAFKSTPTYREYLRAAWGQVQRETGSSGDFESFWRSSLQRGGVFQKVSFGGGVKLAMDSLTPLSETKLIGDGLVLLATASLRHGDGRGASNPWLQEVPDPVSQVVWGSWAEINPKTAEKMGISHGDEIRVTSPNGMIETAAYMHYGVHEDAIAIPMGQGHTASGLDADQRGINVVTLLPAAYDKTSGEFAYLSTRVKIEKINTTSNPLHNDVGGKGNLIHNDGSPRQLGRKIIQTMSFKDAVEGKAPEIGEAEQDNPNYFYEGNEKVNVGYHHPYRWGMTVDVDRCIGCSACAAACYSENNIPVVGPERNALGREMGWLRIERYIEGEGDSFKMLMQPMFCQHCSNAGCEPVCPVYATYHNPDGLNAQVYNRCVGTRYCSNNCAYKVRRFNWFEYEFRAPLHLQLNPDVTVRSRGVMEKCTFCVQRIQRAKMAAHAEGREVKDGEITPACVQTCPTKALTFGNLSDPESAVSKRAMRGEELAKKRVRQYEVLPETRNLPAVTYLRKVTLNQNTEA